MFWELLDGPEKAHVMIKILAYIAKADGKLQENELAYLLYVAQKINVAPEDVRQILVDNQPLHEMLPSDEQDRMNVLYHLLFMMSADKTVADEEEKALYYFGLKLGFSEWMVKDFLEVFKTYDIDDLPPGAMVDIIKKYQN